MRKSTLSLPRAAIAVAAIATLATSACSSRTASPTSGADKSNSVTEAKVAVTDVPGSIPTLPTVVAQQMGYFKAQHLNVSLVPITSGAASTQALLSGSAQIMFNSVDSVLAVNDKGQSVKIIAGALTRAFSVLLARNSWPLPHAGSYPAVINDLKGAKVGVSALGTAQEIYVRQMLTEAGLNPDHDVTFVAVGALSAGLAALETGKIDALMSYEPAATLALKQLKIAKVVVDFRKGQGPADLINQSPDVYATTGEYLKSHTDVVKRFVAAISSAQAWMADPANLSELQALVAKTVAVDSSLVPGLVADNLSLYGATVPRQNIENAVSVNRKAGLIKGNPTYEEVVATDIVPRK